MEEVVGLLVCFCSDVACWVDSDGEIEEVYGVTEGCCFPSEF